MSEDTLKKIIISEETFEALKRDLTEQIQRREDVKLLVLPKMEVFAHLILRTPNDSAVILNKKEELEIVKLSVEDFKAIADFNMSEIDFARRIQNMSEIDFAQRIKEINDKIMKEFTCKPELLPLPKMLDVSYVYVKKSQNSKPYVPRVIGKPNSKARGGR